MSGRYFATRPTLTDGQAINEVAVDDNGLTMVAVSGSTTDGDPLEVIEQQAPAYEDNTNGVAGVLQKPTVTNVYSGTPFFAGDDADLSVKATPGNLLSIRATNENAAVRYLHLFNKASAPAGADVPILSLIIPAGTATAPAVITLGSEFLGQNGLYFSTGIAVGISTAIGTFTAATAGDCFLSGVYK